MNTLDAGRTDTPLGPQAVPQVPKLLPFRLFSAGTNASLPRFSLWLDGKLKLLADPLEVPAAREAP